MKRMTALLFAALLILSVTAMIACGDDDVTTTTTTSAQPGTTAPQSQQGSGDPLPGAGQFANDNEASYNADWKK